MLNFAGAGRSTCTVFSIILFVTASNVAVVSKVLRIYN